MFDVQCHLRAQSEEYPRKYPRLSLKRNRYRASFSRGEFVAGVLGRGKNTQKEKNEKGKKEDLSGFVTSF
jgi:hypothetical protein